MTSQEAIGQFNGIWQALRAHFEVDQYSCDWQLFDIRFNENGVEVDLVHFSIDHGCSCCGGASIDREVRRENLTWNEAHAIVNNHSTIE